MVTIKLLTTYLHLHNTTIVLIMMKYYEVLTRLKVREEVNNNRLYGERLNSEKLNREILNSEKLNNEMLKNEC